MRGIKPTHAVTPKPSRRGTGGSKTRLNSQTPSEAIEVCIDWLQFTGDVPAGELHRMFMRLEELLREKLVLRPGKPTMTGRTWQNSGRSPNSFKVAWDKQDQNGKCHCFIGIPAGVLSSLTVLQIRQIAEELTDLGMVCTRIDIAVDDFKKRLSKEKVIKALTLRNHTKFSKKKIQDSFDDGWCLYFGRRDSARCTRLYDKHAESKGKIQSTRLETQFNAKVAKIVLGKWLEISPEALGEQWQRESAKYLMKSVIGSIDFVDRASNPDEKNVSRLKRLDWWQKFCDLVDGHIYHTAPVPKQSLEKRTGWMKRQVLKSMYCVFQAIGEENARQWLEHRLSVAGGTINRIHQKLIEQFSKEWELYKDEVDYGMPGYT